MKQIEAIEAVRNALSREPELERGKLNLVEPGVEFCRELRAKGRPAQGTPADKAFRDSLYEEDTQRRG